MLDSSLVVVPDDAAPDYLLARSLARKHGIITAVLVTEGVLQAFQE